MLTESTIVAQSHRSHPAAIAELRKPPFAVDTHFPDHPSLDSKHPEVRIDLYSISPNPALAAGEPLAGKRPVKPRLPL